MNNAQWRYYALNQFMLGKKFDALPEECRNVISSSRHVWEAALRLEECKLSSLEQTFISFLRVRDYGLCLGGKGLLSISQIVEIIQSQDLNVSNCSQWASAAIADVKVIDVGSLCIKDGILYVPSVLLSANVDIDGALRTAFAMICWGSVNPTPECKEFVREVKEYIDPTDDINLTAEEFNRLLFLANSTGVRPNVFAQTVFLVHDLSVTHSLTKTLCWWSDVAHSDVTVIIPRGKLDKLARARINFEEFLKLYGDNPNALCSMRAHGQTIVYGADL